MSVAKFPGTYADHEQALKFVDFIDEFMGLDRSVGVVMALMKAILVAPEWGAAWVNLFERMEMTGPEMTLTEAGHLAIATLPFERRDES